ncbi:MAG: cellulase family glycosylhydrolase [Planctomycetes bacterium]|nr:cellulase family glycosylhydrolase [Planctomycetota bacterium]
MLRHASRTLVLVAAVGLLLSGEAPKELLPNGDMEKGNGSSPAHWAGTWGTDDANRFLRLKGGQPSVTASRIFPLDGQRALQLGWRYRHDGLVRDDQGKQDARMAIDFLDAAGQQVLPGPAYPTFAGSSNGWQKSTLKFFVPPGATAIRITPALIGQTAGTLDLDQFSMTVISPSDVPEEARTTGNISVDAGGKHPTALRVDGKRLVDAAGAELWLQGLSVPSLEWKAEGDAIITSIATGIEVWKANVIRLPVKGDFWFGTGKNQQADGGKAYRELVDQAVLACASRGAYLILDLHRFRAPNDKDVEFWKDAAARYKDNPAVLFGLFNEPHDVSWEVWKSGGKVEEKKKSGDALAENKEVLTSFQSCGMQGLIDTVRGVGAKNAVLVGGLDWAYDLSGVLNGFDLDDKGGNGIIWDTHVYPWKSDWQGKFLEVAKTRAVLVGEVGCDQVRYDFIPPERFESPYTWALDMIGCIQQNRLHWTAWAFHPRCGPPMIQDQSSFTPTPFWGAFVRSALLGKPFAPAKLR